MGINRWVNPGAKHDREDANDREGNLDEDGDARSFRCDHYLEHGWHGWREAGADPGRHRPYGGGPVALLGQFVFARAVVVMPILAAS
jgi:hypothetical protein